MFIQLPKITNMYNWTICTRFIVKLYVIKYVNSHSSNLLVNSVIRNNIKINWLFPKWIHLFINFSFFQWNCFICFMFHQISFFTFFWFLHIFYQRNWFPKYPERLVLGCFLEISGFVVNIWSLNFKIEIKRFVQ